MADSVRAVGWEPQSAIGTPVTVVNCANWVEVFGWDPNIGTRVPSYQTGQRIQETRVLRTTKRDTLTIGQGNVDLYEFLKLLQSNMGPPASGVYKFGTALNSTPTAFLTFRMMMGLTENWRFQDSRVNKLEITADAANGTLQYTAEIFAKKVTGEPTLSAWVPTRSVPAFPSEPFDPWQFVLLKGGAAPPGGCAMMVKLTLDNRFNPLYCFPVADPTGSTEPGLFPSRYTDNPPQARVAITLEYTGYTGSAFKDFLTHAVGAWSLRMIDPGTTTAGSLVWDLPQLDWISPSKLDWTQPETRFVGSAALLLDGTSATSVSATAVLPT